LMVVPIVVPMIETWPLVTASELRESVTRPVMMRVCANAGLIPATARIAASQTLLDLMLCSWWES
jgi:hypothetical protein